MPCKKPSGNPVAINRAADAICDYAAGIDGVFGAADHGIARYWTGSAADEAVVQLGDYHLRLHGYADDLRAYAEQLRQYAHKLEQAQKCTIMDILTWVFIVVFAIIEIVVGLFFGGAIEGLFAALFDAILMTILETVTTVGEVMLDVAAEVVEGSAMLGRIVGSLADASGDLVNLGETAGSFGIRTAADVAGSGAEVTDDALAASMSTTQVVTDKVLSFIADLPMTMVEKGTIYVKNLIQNMADSFFQQTMIYGIESLNPKNGRFADMWSVNDGKLALAFVIALVGGGLGAELSVTFTAEARTLLMDSGIELAETLTILPKIGDLGAAIERETGIKLANDVFRDVMGNAWVYAVVNGVYPALTGTDFSWKDFWWYVSFGVLIGVLGAPLTAEARSITNSYIGEIFPGSVAYLKDNHPVLSDAAASLGSMVTGSALTLIRKLGFDPLVQLGPLYAIQHPAS